MPVQVGPFTIGPPDTPPPAVDTTKRQQALDILATAHKGLTGGPSKATDSKGGALPKTASGQEYEHYTFNDGSSIDIAPDGSVYASDFKEPTKTETTTFGNADVGIYKLDANGQPQLLVPAKVPNADDEMSKALERMDRQQQMAQKQANEAAGRGYMTDLEYQKLAQDAAAQGLNQAQLAEKINEFNRTQAQQQKQFDAQMAQKDKTDAADVLLKGAQTGQITQATDLAKALEPTTIAQAGATLAGTQASTAATQANTQRTQQQIQQGNAPTVQTPATGMYTWTRDPNTGQVTATGMNPEWQAKTQADVNARVGQIQNYMQQKSAEIQGRVDSKQITPDQGLQEWNSWYQQNVAPQQGALQAAQQQAQFQQAKDQADLNRQNYQQALTAGVQAASAASQTRTTNYLNAGSAALGGGAPDWGALNKVQFQGPSSTDAMNQGFMDALKYISPTAAAATGTPMPNFAGVDINQALSPTQYLPRGGPAAAAVGAGTGIAAPPAPPPSTSMPFGAISPSGMAGIMPPPTAPTSTAPSSWSQSAPNFGAYPAMWPNYTYAP